MKVVFVITRFDIKPLYFGGKKLLQFKDLINFLREVIFPYASEIVKDSQIFRLNKFY